MSEKKSMTYAESGVSIEAGDEMVDMIKKRMRSTHGPRVMGQHGAFAGMFRLDYNEQLFKKNYKDPVLVSCTDGVGTKVLLACQLKKFDTVGQDCVGMNVNDMIVQGAEPLFFLDYIGTSKLDPEWMTQIVSGVAAGCELAGCALLGGETAEMPDVYSAGEFDLAGFAVGVVELHKIVDGTRVEEGDKVIGITSDGVHSNGFSLVRAIIKEADLDLEKVYPELDESKTLGEVLLVPTRIYVKPVISVFRNYTVKKVISGMAHITGGGLVGNINRALPEDLDAVLDRKSWEPLPIFKFLQKHGNVEQEEMDRVFNNGIGYTIIARPTFADSIVRELTKQGETAMIIGEITKGSGIVKIND